MNNKGFTLIEAIVALAIFIAISATLAQIIVVSIQNQIKITTTQNMFNQAIFSLDKIEKELRMAKKDGSGGCVDVPGNNYATSLNSITFLHHDQVSGLKCKKFTLKGGRIKEYMSNDETKDNFGIGVDLTGSSIAIDALNFNVIGDGPNDLQPRVTITMEIKNGKVEDQSPVMLQTTISQRRLDLQ